MPKNLIVITKLFPYNFTEAFLESETPFLQEKFKNIIFMPVSYTHLTLPTKLEV